MLVLFIVAIPSAFAAQAEHAMVVAESAAAARAGVDILKLGGNAVDAAVATALATGVTNPASCGIGGGGFMLIYLAKTGQFYSLDYRETAPAAASATMYVRDGKPDERLAQAGALAVGVPGELKGDEAALERFGTMKFSQAAAPAIRLARSGFHASSHLAEEIKQTATQIAADPGLRGVFLDSSGNPLKAGDQIIEKNLAATLSRLGDDPVKNFYSGTTAGDIASFIKQHGGIVTQDDLAHYQPLWRHPIHLLIHGFDVYTMPPPSSAGVALEILAMLAEGNIAGLGVNSPPYLARLIEVMRQGFIDRDSYGDPAFVKVPITSLLSPAHIAQARERALHQRAGGAASPTPAHDHGTANLCVVDKDGNVVVLTTTINTPFGAKMMVPSLGLILNDEMDDFGVAPGTANAYHLVAAAANDIAPGKRPLSSMSPTIVMMGGRPLLALGGSGGPTIITGVVQVFLNVLAFHFSPGQAVTLPRIHEQASPDMVLIQEVMPRTTVDSLRAMGYAVKLVPSLGAVNAINVAPGQLRGAFDPLKGGGAVGY